GVRSPEVGRVPPARHPQPVRPGGDRDHPVAGGEAGAAEKRGTGLIPLTTPEVRRLLLRLVWDRLTPAEQALAWSDWRRRHQHRARVCHYRRRRARPPDG